MHKFEMLTYHEYISSALTKLNPASKENTTSQSRTVSFSLAPHFTSEQRRDVSFNPIVSTSKSRKYLHSFNNDTKSYILKEKILNGDYIYINKQLFCKTTNGEILAKSHTTKRTMTAIEINVLLNSTRRASFHEGVPMQFSKFLPWYSRTKMEAINILTHKCNKQ